MKTCFSETLSKAFPPEKSLDISAILGREEIGEEDLWNLLSDPALNHLEEMARKAQDLTLRHFGRVIGLYAPLYISNYCDNECLYCGFNLKNKIRRKKLDSAEIKREAEEIASKGIQHLLVLTGDSRKQSPVSYISECLAVLKNTFSSLSLEIYPCSLEEYRQLSAAGADSLTIYQETYDEALYKTLHVCGPKQDFHFRLEAAERAAQAGMRQVNIGALLGLSDPQRDIFRVGQHARWLTHRYPEAEIGVSLPRLKKHEGVLFKGQNVSDQKFVQMMLALRLFMPRSPLAISTRESYDFRSNLIGLGVTRMSAGSRTEVGGYGSCEKTEGQFEVEDKSSVDEVVRMISDKGYQAVFKDWQML